MYRHLILGAVEMHETCSIVAYTEVVAFEVSTRKSAWGKTADDKHETREEMLNNSVVLLYFIAQLCL